MAGIYALVSLSTGSCRSLAAGPSGIEASYCRGQALNRRTALEEIAPAFMQEYSGRLLAAGPSGIGTSIQLRQDAGRRTAFVRVIWGWRNVRQYVSGAAMREHCTR